MVRFMQKGRTKVRFATTIASATLVPTTAEATSATDLTVQLSEINGFTFSNNPISTPDMSTTFVSNIPGEDTADASSMVFYEDTVTNPISTALAKGTVGYVLFFRRGLAGASPAIGDKCDVWPVQVSSNVPMYSTGNEASRYTVNFACTAVPGFEKTLT
jgi:hypothetical protein